ncbi:MAG: hypothetical protein OD918_00160 [Gammaproteobacteria bacterium]
MANAAHKFDPPPPQTESERLRALETAYSALAKREDVIALTGKMNTRFERVDAAVKAVKVDVKAVKAEVQAVKAEVQAVKAEVQALKDDVQAVKEDMKELERSLKAEVQAVKSDVKGLAATVTSGMAELHRKTAEREAIRTRWEAGILVAVVGLAVAILFRLGPFGA